MNGCIGKNEVWVVVEWTDGAYAVSDFGRVKSFRRYIGKRMGVDAYFPEKILTGTNKRYGVVVAMRTNGVTKTIPVHRLVAEAFVDNPLDYKYVVHKNFVRTDNRAANLTWSKTNEAATKENPNRVRARIEMRSYNIWRGMKSRCTNKNNPKWQRYGGRGVSICVEWMDFETFLRDMGECPNDSYSIDRIDKDGNYCPQNCRWADSKQQSRNSSAARLLVINGEKRCVSEWSEVSGVNKMTILNRLSKGWSDKDAVFREVDVSKRNRNAVCERGV